MNTGDVDRFIEAKASEFIHWWLSPKRKPAVTNWTAGWERQIGYLMEFAASNASKKTP